MQEELQEKGQGETTAGAGAAAVEAPPEPTKAAAPQPRRARRRPAISQASQLLLGLGRRVHAAGRDSPAFGALVSAAELAGGRAASAWAWFCSLPPCRAASAAARRLAGSRRFEGAMQLLVLLNVVVMSLPYEGMPDRLDRALDAANSVFAFLFVCEMLIQLAAAGPSAYLAVHAHKLDVVINAMSVADFALSALGAGVSLSAIRSLRMLRILRFVKLVRHFEVLRIFIESLAYTLSSLASFLVLMFIVAFAFALCGMQIFGCE